VPSKKFFLKFARDRRRYLYWVFEAKTRTAFPFSILGLSNYIDLLVNIGSNGRPHYRP